MYWLIPCVLFGLFLVSMYVVWILTSHSNFPHLVMPGGRYEIDGRWYSVPRLPHKTYGSAQEPRLDRPVPMLHHDALRDLRALIADAFAVLDEARVEFWVTGGTLISAVLWKSLMCYDDDCDVAVSWEDREYLWSPEFASMLASRDLETFYLRGASLTFATREMAAVRVRRRGTITPTLDIFFVREMEDGRWGKVNTWSRTGDVDSVTYSESEVWDGREWVFPLTRLTVDGMTWPVPAMARAMLDKQYGEDWIRYIQSPNPLTNSHWWAFWISNAAGAWRVGPVSDETDVKILRNPRAERRAST